MLSGCAEVLDIPTEPRLVRDGMKERSGMWSHSGRPGRRWAPDAAGSQTALAPVERATPPLELVPDAAAADDRNAADLSAIGRATMDAAQPPIAGAGSRGGEELFASLDAGPDALLSHTDELPRGQRTDDGNRAGAAR
jgi:hypothetical protein